MKINSKRLRQILDKMNNEYKMQFGYEFCRCYDCAFSALLNCMQRSSTTDCKNLGEIVELINDDYLHSVDYRDYTGNSGLECGYGCTHNEDTLEAVPFLFWEIDKSHLKRLEALLSNRDFQDCFSTD